jgi:putative phosphoesterase
MRVALISDLHGNAVALRAVLDELRAERVDRIVCLGDVATLGPAPGQVIGMLADLGCACILGNHDAFLFDAELIKAYAAAPIVVDAVDACRSTLGASELAFLRTFQPTLELDLGGAQLGLFHGSPRSHMEDLLATTPASALDEALGEERPAVMAGGHTHIQMMRQHRGTLLVNPGSLGMPFETFADGGPPKVLPHAEYAIVESHQGAVSVTLRRLPLDPAALRSALEGWDSPMRAYLQGQYARA